MAAQIIYDIANLGGTTWRYDYKVDNASGLSAISEFTIYFDRAKYSNLVLSNSPIGWNSVVIQPDQALSSDGFLAGEWFHAGATFFLGHLA